jgi:hypothetical protein
MLPKETNALCEDERMNDRKTTRRLLREEFLMNANCYRVDNCLLELKKSSAAARNNKNKHSSGGVLSRRNIERITISSTGSSPSQSQEFNNNMSGGVDQQEPDTGISSISSASSDEDRYNYAR